MLAQPNNNDKHHHSNDKELARILISELLKHSDAVRNNQDRKSYAPWFKSMVMSLMEKGFSLGSMESLLGIGGEVLRGFRKSSLIDLTKRPIDEISKSIMAAWNSSPEYYKKTLDHFWSFIGRNHANLKISREQMRQILIDLGLKYPRGPKIEDHGSQVKKLFSPHTIWEGDGKQMNIFINGNKFSYCWYAFCDQRTTLLVGSSIGATESSETFLSALKNGADKIGFYAIGLLIDNRLSDADLSAVKTFCLQHNIAIVRTFPGNSKTNGNIENNFSIFERQVGDIHVRGNNSDEIAKSIAQNISEIFTQQRNHSKRARLGFQTPEEESQNRERPEWHRDAVESLARRLNGEPRRIDEKWNLIFSAREHFGNLDPESELKLKNEIGKYTVMDLIAAQASYLAQIKKHPDSTYRSEYFLAILRYKREQIAKQSYNEAYRAGIELLEEWDFENEINEGDLVKNLVIEFDSLKNQPSPSHQLLKLDAIAWWLVRYSTKNRLYNLWEEICHHIEMTNSVTLKQWSQINEYLFKKIGELLYLEPSDSEVSFTERFESAMV